MKATLRRYGGSLYIVVKPSIVEELNLKEGDIMDMQKKGKSIVINKIDKGDKK
jgi:antitoxin component of MazEF toxin-antitoxin module